MQGAVVGGGGVNWAGGGVWDCCALPFVLRVINTFSPPFSHWWVRLGVLPAGDDPHPALSNRGCTLDPATLAWPRSQRSSTTSPSASSSTSSCGTSCVPLALCLHSCCYCFIEQKQERDDREGEREGGDGRGVHVCGGGLNARRDCGNFSIVACLIIAIVGFFTSRRGQSQRGGNRSETRVSSAQLCVTRNVLSCVCVCVGVCNFICGHSVNKSTTGDAGECQSRLRISIWIRIWTRSRFALADSLASLLSLFNSSSSSLYLLILLPCSLWLIAVCGRINLNYSDCRLDPKLKLWDL